jgi:hypothetical protein
VKQVENNQQLLLEKVLELVGAMGELREQLKGFMSSCNDKDCDIDKIITNLQSRMLTIETNGATIVRELLKEESNKIDSQNKMVGALVTQIQQIQTDLGNLKVDTTKKNWRDGVIISFISVMVTLTATYLLDHFLTVFMH